MNWMIVLLVLVMGCSGAEFEAIGAPGPEAGGSAGAAEAGAAGHAGSGHSGAPSAGGTDLGGSAGIAAAGASGVTAGGTTAACTMPDLTGRLPTTMVWQDFKVQIGDWCGRCRDTPCHTGSIEWRYPLEQLDATTFRASVQVTSTYVSLRSGPCGADDTDCSVKFGGGAWIDLHLVPTANGWKIGSVRQHYSDPLMPDGTFFTADPGSCDPGKQWKDNTGTMRDDLYVDFKALLLSQSWSCP